MTTRKFWSLLCVLWTLCTACGRAPGHDARATAPAPAPQQAASLFTQPLLRDLQTYCYACHHGDTGQTFDKFSHQPAFFVASSETEVTQNVREIAGRAIRYLRSAQMPKSTNPPLPREKRRDMIKALKALATAPPTTPAAVPEPGQIAYVRAAYEEQLRDNLTQKCGVCHAQEANFFQTLLFGGVIQFARHAWDSTHGFPFGGDYAPDPLLQLSKLEVAVVTRSMPPVYYTASFPDAQLSPDDIAGIRAWILQARAVYEGQPLPRLSPLSR